MSTGPSVRTRPAAGFTLIEMLVALGVFAVIGLLSAQIVTQMVDVNERTRTRADRLVNVQRAVEVLRRDIQQLAHRHVRDELGDPVPTLDVNQIGLMRFTRRGWSNPLELKRSELQRVAYVLEGELLYRVFWPVLDRGAETQPVSQLLLDGVETVEVTAIDVSGRRHAYWPLAGESADDPERELAAFEIRLAVPPYGEIDRLWAVPFSGVPREDGESGDEDAEEDQEDAGDERFEETPIDAVS
ncbi:MAG: type II secretion system protein GspJ [Gammaproteobacteria bacterium]|nr:type II secretion system protein GspJ [Gammaproteobacteria bacterium]MYE81509.1 type II secretion system protein GspJ [Gammaproteobacteria bacterium]